MADNIIGFGNSTGVDEVPLAAKDVGGVYYARTILTGADGSDLPMTGGPLANTPGIPVRPVPLTFTDISFPQVGSGLQTPKMTLIGTGAGMAVSQASGNLIITTGTTANSETVIRSVATFQGALTMKEVTTLSQRIANNNFYVELVDVIGDNLAYTIITTTTVDVVKTAHGYTAINIGQRMDACDCVLSTGTAVIPGEWVILSITDANTIRFTVPTGGASGTGTLSLTGWNKIELNYTGVSATAVNFNTRREGWQNTSAATTTTTTASPVLGIANVENGVVSVSDKSLSSIAAITNRASWDTNIPQPDVVMYLQIRAKNGTAAPATTTTWTLGMLRVEDYVAQQVSLTAVRPQSVQNPLAVSGTLNISGVSATINTAATAGTNLSNDVGIQARANATGAATVAKIASAATTNATSVKATAGRVLGYHFTNTTAAVKVVRFYNLAVAPTVGTSVPVYNVIIPANGYVSESHPVGIGHATGIAYAITGAIADLDATAVAANDVIGAIYWA